MSNIKSIKNFQGMSFYEWCLLDSKDERKINYVFKSITKNTKKNLTFSSEDKIDLLTLCKIRVSTIIKLTLEDNEWHVNLEYKE